MHVQGPNFVWSNDGYDKLHHWEFYIHRCIDAYSRYIIWIYVVVFLGIIPHVIRADLGVEYNLMALVQMLVHENHNDVRAGSLSWRYGNSTSNQRIEAWWSFLRKYISQFWIELFTEIEAAGEWNYFDYINRRLYIYIYGKFCDDPSLGEYFTLQRTSELDSIVKNILYNIGDPKIDITNARQVYYILRTYLHELSD
ncbi:unnamed protein product [Rhizophagus irregularis]|nr:unnamed protein product [Rhizophagus irregularis]CAB5199532.1 unnamed protein product [Rhizophagus irregularis]